jgi:hypothetical protein
MNKIHDVEKLAFMDDEMIITVDGTEHRFLLVELSPKLAVAGAVERERFEISPSGYGIHWPLLDEDLSIDGMLGVNHAPSFSNKRAA